MQYNIGEKTFKTIHQMFRGTPCMLGQHELEAGDSHVTTIAGRCYIRPRFGHKSLYFMY